MTWQLNREVTVFSERHEHGGMEYIFYINEAKYLFEGMTAISYFFQSNTQMLGKPIGGRNCLHLLPR